MIYTVDASVDVPIMLINKHIGFDEEDGMGIDGSLFQRELLELDNMGKKAIEIWINSPGGVVVDGYSIANAILRSKTPVDTVNVGIAASIAGVIFMAGRKRKMADYALMMIHSPSGGENQKVIDAMEGSLVKMIAAKSSTTEEDVKYLMKRTSWLSASECLNKGFCTEIEVTKDSNKKWTSTNDVKAIWKDCTVIMNNILKPVSETTQKNTVMQLTKVTMKLGLNDAATEDNILDEIKKIENRAYTAETKVIKMEGDHARALKEVTDKATADAAAATEVVNKANNERDAAKAQVTEITNKLTAAEAELKKVKDSLAALEKEKNDALEAEKQAKAEALVDSHVKTGRIKNEAKIIERYVNMAKDDFEGTKELIESIPLGVKAPVIVTDAVTKTGDEMGTNAMTLAVRNRLKREGKL